MRENNSCGEVINFELFGENCIKIITTGQTFLLNYNYQSFQNNQVNLYEFFILGMYVPTKIPIIAKFYRVSN
jgi:hypothetical protein